MTGADFIVDCGAVIVGAPATFVKSGPASLLTALKPLVVVPQVLSLAWPDFGVPPVGLAFWRALWDLLPPGKIIFCCQGGHGRSGTALSAMLIADGYEDAAAIQLVRSRHCKEAGETEGQKNYLARLYAEALAADADPTAP